MTRRALPPPARSFRIQMEGWLSAFAALVIAHRDNLTRPTKMEIL
jgi:hypothetical protein